MSEQHLHSHTHPHPGQPDLEDTPLTHYQAMTYAVAGLLIEKGIVTADEMRAQLESIDSKSPAEGARVIARAWVDSDFKARMLQDVNAAAAELDIDAGPIPIRARCGRSTIRRWIWCGIGPTA